MNAGDFVSLLASPGSVPSAIETARDIGLILRMHLLGALQMHSQRQRLQGPGCAFAGGSPRSQPQPREVK